MKIAEVIVDITNSQVDKIFDYEAPDWAKVGMRVYVPFGNRTIHGFIINIKDDTNIAKSKLKKIADFVEDYVVIKEELIDLMYFMVKKYHLRYADCLRLFIPSEMRSEHVKPLFNTFVSLNLEKNIEEYKLKIKSNAKNQQALCEYLKHNQYYLKSELVKKFTRQTVNKLIEDKILLETKKCVYREPYFNKISNKKVEHTPLQTRATDTICAANGTYLLFGVPGSGKTDAAPGRTGGGGADLWRCAGGPAGTGPGGKLRGCGAGIPHPVGIHGQRLLSGRAGRAVRQPDRRSSDHHRWPALSSDGQ